VELVVLLVLLEEQLLFLRLRLRLQNYQHDHHQPIDYTPILPSINLLQLNQPIPTDSGLLLSMVVLLLLLQSQNRYMDIYTNQNPRIYLSLRFLPIAFASLENFPTLPFVDYHLYDNYCLPTEYNRFR